MGMAKTEEEGGRPGDKKRVKSGGIIKKAWPEPFVTLASGYFGPSLLQLLINLDYVS